MKTICWNEYNGQDHIVKSMPYEQMLRERKDEHPHLRHLSDKDIEDYIIQTHWAWAEERE